ncbi:MAG: hypothetical protein J5J00_15495 [Deltaproteobacteria bacterium]|nr:hypothetical protein [Deltaproteobacteria bacterium]
MKVKVFLFAQDSKRRRNLSAVVISAYSCYISECKSGFYMTELFRLIACSAIIVLVHHILSPIEVSSEPIEGVLQERGLLYSEPEAPALEEIYYERGITWRYPSAGVSANLNLLLQNGYFYYDHDSVDQKSDQSSFDLHEARLIFSGTSQYEEFRYLLEANLAPSDGASQAPLLEDAYIIWGPCLCSFAKLGQFQTPYGRERQSPEVGLQFVEYAIASDIFNRGPQAGLYGQYNFLDDRIITSASLFNGDSTGEGHNLSATDTKHLALCAIRTAPLGRINPFEEGDLHHSENTSLSFALTYGYEQSENSVTGLDFKSHLANLDVTFKLRGVSLSGEVMVEKQDTALDSHNPYGFYLQGGIFVVPTRLEAAGRFSQVECDGSFLDGCGGSDRVRQATAGINYYFWEHNVKLLLNFERRTSDMTEGGSLDSNRIMFLSSIYL